MRPHKKRIAPKGKPVYDPCPRCGKESVARLRVGKTVFVCSNGHRHSKVLKFYNGREKP